MLGAENAAFENEALEISNDLSNGAAEQGLLLASELAAETAPSHASAPLNEASPPSIEYEADTSFPGHASASALVIRQKAAHGRLVLEAVSQLSAAEKIYAQRELLSSKRDTLKEELERLHDRLSRLEELEQALLAEGKAANGEEFLRRSAAVSRRAELERELRQLETVIFSGLEIAEQSQLEELLSGSSEEELQQRLLAVEKVLEAKESAWRELQERKGRLLQEQESLEQRGRQEEVHQQLAEQKAALQDTLEKYAVMAVCQELIARVRRVYEEERQPEVLRLASAYLQQMTNGRYKRIVLKMGSQELQAEHCDYGAIGSSALSRGTAEQLYLSMRLALADAVSHHRSIPILLDDLFVNFDAARLQGVISVLKQVAVQRQIVMMTCHPHVVEGIQAQIPEAQIVNLA
ncbi:hypothetical protein D3C77_334910 [compost metagenome]